MSEELRAEAVERWQNAVYEQQHTEQPGLFSDTAEYLKELTKLPENYPDNLKENFWGYFTKDVILGNLTPGDKISLKNRMALIVDIAYLAMPDYEYTTEKFIDFTNFKHLGANQAFRGGDGFERVMETQQTRLAITESKGQGGVVISPRRPGIFGRLFGGGR